MLNIETACKQTLQMHKYFIQLPVNLFSSEQDKMMQMTKHIKYTF